MNICNELNENPFFNFATIGLPYWSQVKRKLKAMVGILRNKLPGYLDEFNWGKVYPGDPFDNILAGIAEFYPLN